MDKILKEIQVVTPQSNQTLKHLCDIFRVSGEQELLAVAQKVNKAIRALPILETFCNDVCKEVFE